MRRNKRKSKNEFRYNYDTGHMTFVFEEEGNRFRSLGITHQDRTFGRKNMPLKYNPQRKHIEQSYIRNGIVSKRKSTYSKKNDSRYRFAITDYKNVKSKIRYYKNKRRKK